MCLWYNEKLTKQKLNYFKRNNIKEIIVWKVLRKHNDRYVSPYKSMRYNIGVNVRKRVPKNILKRGYLCYTIQSGALHVYSSRKEARYHVNSSSNIDSVRESKRNVIRCRVKVKDIIAYGTKRDIAVKALYIDKFSEKP